MIRFFLLSLSLLFFSYPAIAETIVPMAMESHRFSQNDNQISTGKVGPFVIGKPLNKIGLQRKSLLKDNETGWEEGVQYQSEFYYFTKGGENLLKIYCEVSSGTEVVDEIHVISNKFATDRNIGVGSKIQDFVEKYPNFIVWYTYVSQRFIIESPDLRGMQFNLEEKTYLGVREKMFEKSTINLRIQDFNLNGTIKSIRVFKNF